ncbi:CAP domain-containing protein [Acinetobacter sp. NIPH 2699]|uniref:CAP domain-containing protein n=1 Tax=Acinetobacter sp. NIPH 2699 TaxID=2923433 RepID=UPI001F4B58C1|nr:CAP domain-containing protein [Acinetobacter sp. NIPH 2699]MCH7336012.1 CAP domain-containing protein [Acinetobacter sp. NIPH 2699]
MNDLKLFIQIPFLISITACSSASTPNISQEPKQSVIQIQKASAKITCQDLQNPAYQQAIVTAINEIRRQPRQCGQRHFPTAPPLIWNNQLYQSAFAHTKDMTEHNFLGHVSSTGLDLKARLKLYQFKGRGGGENVAHGQKDLNEVIASWLTSPVHCSNIMQPKFTDYAIACAPDQSAQQRNYWTQQFGVR